MCDYENHPQFVQCEEGDEGISIADEQTGCCCAEDYRVVGGVGDKATTFQNCCPDDVETYHYLGSPFCCEEGGSVHAAQPRYTE